jgi:hypothetical protein
MMSHMFGPKPAGGWANIFFWRSSTALPVSIPMTLGPVTPTGRFPPHFVRISSAKVAAADRSSSAAMRMSTPPFRAGSAIVPALVSIWLKASARFEVLPSNVSLCFAIIPV